MSRDMRRYAGSRALLARSARNRRRAVGTGFSPPKEAWLWPVYPKQTPKPWEKDRVTSVVDALPDESRPAAAILLRRAQDPVAAKLDAAPLRRGEADRRGWRIEIRPAALKSLRKLGRKDRERAEWLLKSRLAYDAPLS
jgi:hypothetical protein